MKRVSLLPALLALVILAGCNDSSLPPGATYATVAGVIVDSASKAPVAGATVTLDTILTVTSDKDGKFSQSVPSGDFDYSVTSDGYKPITASGHVDPGKTIALTIELTR